MSRQLNRHFNPKLLSLIIILLTLGSSALVSVEISKLATNVSTSQQNATPSGQYFDHLVVIMMENQGIGNVCGGNPPPCNGANTPYESTLANTYGISQQDVALINTSWPDYYGIIGASIFGCPSNCYPAPGSVNAINLVDRFESAGVSWKGYFESQPMSAGCATSDSEPYTYIHNGFVLFQDITTNAARCSNLVLANPSGCSATDCALINDLNSGSAPNFMWLTPSDCNDMRGSSACANGCTSDGSPTCVQAGDSYLKSLVPNILSSGAFQKGRSALFITYDEGVSYCPLNGSNENCVYAVWAGPTAKTAFSSPSLYNHYSLTKTIEVNWNLPSLNSNDGSANPMTEFLKPQAPPLATSFTYSPASPQTGQQVTFTATASGGTPSYTYSWNFGDGSNGSGSNVTHTYSSPGTYTVILSTTDSGSPQQTATSQQSIMVTNPAPSPLTASFTYTPSSPQKGQLVTFSSSAGGGTAPYSFKWSFGDGSTGAGATASHAYSSTGTFTVILTVTDSGTPLQTTTSQQSVIVTNPPPALTSSFSYTPSSPTTGQQVTFTGSASGGTSPYSYSWTFGDGSIGTGSSTSHAYQSAGNYVATLTVTDTNGQSASSTQTIAVAGSTPPPLTDSFTFSPSTPDTGQLVKFSGSASGGTQPYSYSWSFGDSGIGTGSPTTHAFQSGGLFNVTLTVTDAMGKTASSSQTITVNPPLSASFTYSPTNPAPLQTVTFTSTTTGGSSPYTYSWDFGDGTSGNGASPSHSYLLPGTYTVTLTVTDANGQTTTTSQAITVAVALTV